MPMDPALLIARRNKLGLTQREVAEAASMKQQEYARLESGGRRNPRIETLETVAAALKCKVDDLLVKAIVKRRK